MGEPVRGAGAGGTRGGTRGDQRRSARHYLICAPARSGALARGGEGGLEGGKKINKIKERLCLHLLEFVIYWRLEIGDPRVRKARVCGCKAGCVRMVCEKSKERGCGQGVDVRAPGQGGDVCE